MKIFNRKEIKEPKKSWSIELKENSDDIDLIAVDSNLGNDVAYLLCFHKNGTISTNYGVKEELERIGYDPYEHSNKFDSGGALVIE